MIEQYFTSEASEDIIYLSHSINSKSCNIYIKKFDEIPENIRLLSSAIKYLICNNIKWIIVDVKDNYIVPQNCYCYKNKNTGSMHCHIEDFEKFYLYNMSNIIKPNNVHVKKETDITEDGWITIADSKKNKKTKMNKLNMLKNNLL